MKQKTFGELEKFDERRKIGLEKSLKKKEKRKKKKKFCVFFIFPPI